MAQGRLVLALPTRNRDFGRVVAQVFCALFALFGALPLVLGFFLSSATVENWAARETSRILQEQLGLAASFRVELKLLPLRVTVSQLIVPASDGGTPALSVARVAVTPRIFSLLAGRLDAGDVEIDQMRPLALEQCLQLRQITAEKRGARVRLSHARDMFARPRRPSIDLDVEDSRESLPAVPNRHRQPERAVLRLDTIPVAPTVLVVLDIVVVHENVRTAQLIEEPQPG